MCVGEDVRTERDLPPFIYGKKQSFNTFPIESEKEFHLHGGIQFEYETKSFNDQLPQYVSSLFRSISHQSLNQC